MEQRAKIIDGTEYFVTQMTAIEALKIQTKIIKLLGSGLQNLITFDNTTFTPEAIKSLLGAIADNFDDDLANTIVLDLFKRNIFYQKDDRKISVEFSTHFAGKMPEMWQVVAFILEVNFIPQGEG